MKNLKLMLAVLCTGVLLSGGQLFGQNKKGKEDIMYPVKADNYKEIANQLTNEGWKTDLYSIEEQLASTAKLKGEVNPKSYDALYLWVQLENSGSNMKDVREKNYISGVNSLTYKVELPYLSQCQLLLIQRGGSADQLKTLEKITRKMTSMVVQNLGNRSMEIYLEKDKTCTVRSVFMLDKSRVYNTLRDACLKEASTMEENAILIEVFKEAFDRMAKQSLR